MPRRERRPHQDSPKTSGAGRRAIPSGTRATSAPRWPASRSQAGDDTLLIDPLLPPEPAPVLDLVEKILGARLSILITIPYHVAQRRGDCATASARTPTTTIRGHPAVAKRLRHQGRASSRSTRPGAAGRGGRLRDRQAAPLRDAAARPVAPRARLRRRRGRDRRAPARVGDGARRRQGRALLPRALQPDARSRCSSSTSTACS